MWATIPLPITFDMFANALVDICVHECGHMLGLVSELYLGGTKDSSSDQGGGHNPVNNPQHIMNNGTNTPLDWRLGLHGQRQFNSVSTNYLNFTFPKP